MRNFTDEQGATWIADVREEATPRHHGRWYLLFRNAQDGSEIEMPEVRWQTRATGERTIRTMADFELRRRLHIVRGRHASNNGPSRIEGVHALRYRTNVSAG